MEHPPKDLDDILQAFPVVTRNWMSSLIGANEDVRVIGIQGYLNRISTKGMEVALLSCLSEDTMKGVNGKDKEQWR